MTTPLIGIIMGSLTDSEAIKSCVNLIESWGVPYEMLVASPSVAPERAAKWAAEAERRGVEVILAVAGAAPHLPEFVAGQTLLPVISIPLESDGHATTQHLRSTLRNTEGIPVAVVGFNAPSDAAVFALRILARTDDAWHEALINYRKPLAGKIEQQNAQLKVQRPAAIWREAEGESASDPPPPPHPRGEKDAPGTRPPRPPRGDPPGPPPKPPPPPPHPAASRVLHHARPKRSGLPYFGRVRIEAEILPIEIVEKAVDCLVEGGIIALPTDTVYGLAADATNEEAVSRIFALKERSPNKSIAIFIDSQKSLRSIVSNLTIELRSMLEAFWPGPLTVVFNKQVKMFEHLGPGNTIGIRLPDHAAPLMLMQEMRRPLACTSANLAGGMEARSADEVEQIFGRSIDMILDAGTLPAGPVSTVIDVTRIPYRVLREGAISRNQLAAVVGDLIQNEEGERR